MRGHWPAIMGVLLLTSLLVNGNEERPGPDWRPKVDRARVDALKTLAQEGGIDLFIERCFADKISMTDEAWAVFYEAAEEMFRRGKPYLSKHHSLYPLPDVLHERVLRIDALREPGVTRRSLVMVGKWSSTTTSNLSTSVVLLREGASLGRTGPIGGSMVFSLGPIHCGTINASVVLCDNTIETGSFGGSVILARDVGKKASTGGCVLVSRGDMNLGSVSMDALLAHGELKLVQSMPETRFLKPHEDPFADIKFFSTSDIGLDVKQAKTELQITGVKNQSPFGKAGLDPGDVIASANGNPMTDYHAFRRLIRRAYVEETAVSLSVRRQGKPINVKVDFKKPS
jgi:hypothetical protein